MMNTRQTFLYILFSLLLFTFSGCSHQKIEDYIGEWEGNLTNTDALNLELTIELKEENAIFKLSKNKDIITKKFKFSNRINLVLDDNLMFSGVINQDKSVITGFMKSKRDFYPIKLQKKGNFYIGKWNLSIYHHLKPNGLKLIMKEVSDGGFTVYPMLGAYWVMDFKQEKNKVSFKDYKSPLKFEGQLKSSEIVLNVSLSGSFISKIIFKKNAQHKELTSVLVGKNAQINDEWKLSKNRLALPKMEKGISNDSLIGIESVLVAINGKITYEKYFAGFDATTPHDMRSASKSISSSIIGIAIDDKIIKSVDEKLYDFIPQEYQYTKDSLKSKITIKDLLTMSSGLDVNNKANEGYYQEESNDNWLKTVLEAPIAHEPGTYTDYGSANPFLLGVYLNARLDIPLEFYMHEKLFAPLGITNYIMNTDDTGIIPYFGGGLHLTPRDMLKFGQLYLNEGVWNGERIISESWIHESFKKHTRLQDVKDKNEYGYFWWHDSYVIDGKAIKSIEARGAGGQFIFIVPALESVVVITAGNYRNRKGNQSRKIFEEYILPTIID